MAAIRQTGENPSPLFSAGRLYDAATHLRGFMVRAVLHPFLCRNAVDVSGNLKRH